MICVTPLNDKSRGKFEELFTAYYAELGCDDDCAHLVDEYIIPDLLAGLIKAELIKDESGEFVGFVIYQIDEIDNEWRLREGWGDVREIYISPSSRGKGLGKFLLYTAEMKLKESGAGKAYCIVPERAEKFFEACGYKKTDERLEDFDGSIFEKAGLDNCGCKNV